MFENENWDIDEDYLKDFNSDDIFKDKNDEAPILSSENAETKKKTCVTLNTSGLRCNASDSSQKDMTLQPNEPIPQNKVLLEIFKNASSSQVALRNDQKPSNLGNEQECASNETNESRKNLILNDFQESAPKAKPTVKSVLKISDDETKFKRKKNVAFQDSPVESHAAKKLCTEKAKKPQETMKNDVSPDQGFSSWESNGSSTSDASSDRKRSLIDSSKSSAHKSNKRVKKAVVRMFPGPAGILPDNVGEHDVIDLDLLEEKKSDKSNQYADICSQNTKNLFTTGAWQLMMDDLPADFELHDIATVRENAKEYSKSYKKVPYLAGIIQYIDYKPTDPHIILKDLSGKIDARIHNSICKFYPNALGTNVVILVKDVGVIYTSRKFICVIISLENLVSIYSDEERLAETPHLKTLLRDDGTNQRLDESQISVIDETEEQNNDNVTTKTLFQESNPQQQPRSILKDRGNMEKLKEDSTTDISESKIIRKGADKCKNDNARQEPETMNYNCDVHEFDENDSWLGVDIDELNSFKSNQFPSSTPMDSHKHDSNDVVPVQEKKKGDPGELTHLPQSGKIVSSTKQTFTSDKNSKTVSDKLLAFRNPNDTSRQPPISKQAGISKDGSSNAIKPFQCQDNDTDDEMLSQLDVDAIAASYSTQNR